MTARARAVAVASAVRLDEDGLALPVAWRSYVSRRLVLVVAAWPDG
jgi:hypothetical protein